MTAIVKKSYRDLSRKKGRTFFTIITIALGVMGMSLFAVSPMADEGVLKEMEKTNMGNVGISVTDVILNETNLGDLEEIDNVNLVEARVIALSKVRIGNRWNNAILVGVSDYGNQKVNRIKTSSGSSPGYMQALSERVNSINAIGDWKKGESITIKDKDGVGQELLITGEGSSLSFSGATMGGYAVFYTTVDTVRELGGFAGYNSISFDLDETDEESMESTIEDIRTYLTTQTTVVAFADLPETRMEGEWEGSEFLGQLMSFMYILTILALGSSVFLISNTMNTIISEQKKEIAQMKAIGAKRIQVFKSFLTTSIIMGVIGSLLGAISGIFISFFVMNSLGRPFGFELPLMVHFPTVIVSFIVGLGIVIAASLPALVRSSRVPVREGLESHGISGRYGKGVMDKLLMRTGKLPRTVQMGMRNIARKKGRSAVTIIQVAMAVGVFLGLVTFGYSLQIAVSGAWEVRQFDIVTFSQGGSGNILTEEEGALLEGIEGVDMAEPFVITGAQINERTIEIWGYVPNTISWDITGTMSKGRWFTQYDHDNNASVLVIGEALAKFENLDVGDVISVMTATGSEKFEIIGLQSSLMDNGQSVMAPMSTLQKILRIDNSVTGFFIHTTSSNHDDIDSVSTALEETMLDSGYVMTNLIHYVMEERNKAQNAGIMDLFLIVSLLIVFISMIGLMSNLTMGILERTTEIGMLRCIGSKASHIRSIFGSEGVFLSLLGWIVGVPVGYMLGVFISEQVAGSMKLHMTFYFPPIYLLYSFLIALIGTFLIIQAPLLRAVRFKPGDALRYQ